MATPSQAKRARTSGKIPEASKKKTYRLKVKTKSGSRDGQGSDALLPKDDEGSALGESTEEAGRSSAAKALQAMEQQLRAGITPTLPASAEARADLARSLSEKNNATAPAAAGVIPRVHDRASIPFLREHQSRLLPARTDSAAAVEAPRWVVKKEWPFEDGGGAAGSKRKRVEHSFPPFYKELWMMMASFGDPRGTIVCRCPSHGKGVCQCLEGVVAMESLVKAFGTRLVEVCLQWANQKRVKLSHVQRAMPGEMREYIAWKEAHSKRKLSEEKKANVHLGDDDVGAEDCDEDSDDEEPDDDRASTSSGGAEKRGRVTSNAGEQLRGDDGHGTTEDREWSWEEEEVAARIAHRRRFADKVTLNMPEDEYLQTFNEFRKAFFLVGRGRKGKVKDSPGSRLYLARYLGLKTAGAQALDRRVFEALAYMMYDYVGVVVEGAIRARTGGRLVAIDGALSADEITAAGSALPELPDRAKRERVRAFRAAHPEGIASKPLARYPIGLEHRGNPLRWPRNTIEQGRVLVEGGELVDMSDGRLAAEAMEVLKSDFADV